MPEESARRRPDFRRGTPARLADGREWTLPGPPGPDAGPGAGGGDADYAALVEAVAAAEDEAERTRAELALAISLLARNYDLGPDDFEALLEPADRSALAAIQRAFRDAASDHVRARRPPGPPARRRDPLWAALAQRLPFLRRRPANRTT